MRGRCGGVVLLLYRVVGEKVVSKGLKEVRY